MTFRIYSFKGADIYNYMEYLADGFNSPLKDSTTLSFPPETGTGFVKSIFLEEDFCIRYFNFSFCSSERFCWSHEKESDQLLYKLVITLVPETADKNAESTGSFTEHSTILFSEMDKPEWLPAHTKVKKMILLFTAQWLNIHFPDAFNKVAEVMEGLSKDNKPAYIVAPMGPAYYALVNEMAKVMDNDTFPLLHIKVGGLMLLEEFLNKETEKVSSPVADHPGSFYYDTMMQVGRRLEDFLHSSMPGIAELASEFNMSPSTLQRHFKIVYGKSIYQYYLEQKLLIGKELIVSGKKSISEVAYILGYNKVNSFSRLFKKYFGVLPKDVNA